LHCIEQGAAICQSISTTPHIYEDVSKSFRTGRLERDLQVLQLSATRCSCIVILWVSLVSFAAITLCVASQRVFIAVSAYFAMDSVRKLLDTTLVHILVRFHANKLRNLQFRAGMAQWYSAGLRAGWLGVRVPAGAGNFSLNHRIQIGSGAHPASYPMDIGGSFLGVKRPGRKADHSPPSSSEVKNAWTHTSTPPIRLHGLVLH
jgi:hypothetical protein